MADEWRDLLQELYGLIPVDLAEEDEECSSWFKAPEPDCDLESDY